MALNCEVKCIQKPRRVPGCAQESVRFVRTVARDSCGPRRCRWPGASPSRKSSATIRTTPTPAAARYAAVQPRWPSAQVIGIAATTAPSWPSGAGELGDQRDPACREPAADQPQHADEGHRVADRRRRRARARATDSCRRRRRTPGPASSAPGPASSTLRGPKRSIEQPDGDLHAGVHQQLEHGEGRELRRGDVEALGGDESGDAERGAVEDGQDVDQQPDDPDDPGFAERGSGGAVTVAILRPPRGS